MEIKKIRTITRMSCPETNSSSSHSFILGIDPFDKDKDLSVPSQELIPKETPDGKKVIILDGKTDDYELHKRTNSSKSKAIYLIASARTMYSSSKTTNKKIDIIKEVIKETLSVDDVEIKNAKLWSIDHQSQKNMETILKSDATAIREFIFNPRSWLFLLWDSEDTDDNPLFDVCPGVLNYEVGLEIPISVDKFLEKPEIQHIGFYKPLRNYPCCQDIYEVIPRLIVNNNLIGYSESSGAIVKKENSEDYLGYYKFGLVLKPEINNPDIFEPLGLVHDEENIYLALLRSTLWTEVWEFHKNKKEKKMNPSELMEFREDNEIVARIRNNSTQVAKQLVDHYFIYDEYIRDYSDLENEFGIKGADIKLLKINIRKRESFEPNRIEI